MQDALARVERWMGESDSRTHLVFFVNAHTLNLACDDPDYRAVLRSADVVYGDGTGVRWAARMLHGARLVDNVNGTDFVPSLFRRAAGRGHRYFLLGGDADMNARAADYARRTFDGWECAGHHHGFLDAAASARVVDAINAEKPQLLLVGMGNPTQERWLHAQRARLRVPVCLGIGGLFAYWSGDLDRAPSWLRKVGFEWLHLLVRQPRKAGRYLLGNPRFLYRVAAQRIAASGKEGQA